MRTGMGLRAFRIHSGILQILHLIYIPVLDVIEDLVQQVDIIFFVASDRESGPLFLNDLVKVTNGIRVSLLIIYAIPLAVIPGIDW